MYGTPLDGGRPRAVQDAPVKDLGERGDELAQAWLSALVSTWPLARMGELPLADLALAGPGICRAALRALADDAVLEGVGEFADTLRGLPPELAVRAVEALRRTLWAALLLELRGAQGAQLAELADRLGHVCAMLAAGAVAPPQEVAAAMRADPIAPEPMQGPRTRRLREAGSVLDGDPQAAAPWLDGIARRLELRTRDGRPFAVLLIEVDGRERLADADLDGDVAAALVRAERVLLKRLRPGDQLLRDQPGRYWVIAPDTDAGAAQLLAWGFAAAPQEVDGHRGVPLLLAVGIALCPDDGEDAQSVAEHAESALLEARSSGVGVAPA